MSSFKSTVAIQVCITQLGHEGPISARIVAIGRSEMARYQTFKTWLFIVFCESIHAAVDRSNDVEEATRLPSGANVPMW